MNILRITSIVVAGVSLVGLAACGQDEAAVTAAAPTASVTTAAPAASAESPSAPVPSSAAPANSDQDVCRAVEKAGEAMKDEVVAGFTKTQGELPSAADFRKILMSFAGELNAATGTNADSAVVSAVRKMAFESQKAAAQTDPMTAADNPAFEKAGTAVTAACKAAGVKVNF